MAWTEVDLGRFEVEQTPSGLRLDLSSHGIFATSGEDEPSSPASAAALTLQHQINAQAWIARLNAFQLILDVILDESVRLEDGRSGVDVIESSFVGAELWDQLRWKVSSLTRHSTCEDETRLQLTLVNTDASLEKPPRKIHRLDPDVPFYHIKPPSNLHTMGLHAVHLRLSISRITSQKKGPCGRKSSRRKASGDCDSGSQGRHSGHRPTCKLKSQTVVAEPKNAVSLLEQDVLLLEHFDSAKGFHDCLDPCSFAPQNLLPHDLAPWYEDSPSIALPIQETLDLEKTNPIQLVHASDLIDLVDSAFRLSISGSPLRRRNGIKISASEATRSLAGFAPAIFSPGYMESMASRAPFLSTISRAMTGLGVMNPERPDLRLKFGEVLRRADMSSGFQAEEEGSGCSRVPYTQTILSRRLWQLMQMQLYNPDATKRLRPMQDKPDMISDLGKDMLVDAESVDDAHEEFEPLFEDDEGRLFQEERRFHKDGGTAGQAPYLLGDIINDLDVGDDESPRDLSMSALQAADEVSSESGRWEGLEPVGVAGKSTVDEESWLAKYLDISE